MGFYFLFVLILPSLIAAVISSPSPVSLKPYLTKLVHNEDLSKAETETVWDSFLSGNADPVMVGAILVALRSKGERSFEVAGMVRAMRKACRQVTIPGKFLDIVGTGGDGADTINISTAAAILAAACGCRIAKAGNRSVSSACGSADVLEALGIKVNMDPSEIEKCINACDIGFMFAPVNHPSMKEVAPIRRSLGVRTVFNILGPLTNAASAKHVVIGVFDKV
jgi:anthranilate phosphoribosyltransferase